MQSFATQSWSQVVEEFARRAAVDARYAPMADAVARLAASSFAEGLKPLISHDTLRLFQHSTTDLRDDELRLDYEGDTFVLRYRSGTVGDPRFSPTAMEQVWTKSGEDAMRLVERAFHHLRWSVDYRVADKPDPPDRAAV